MLKCGQNACNLPSKHGLVAFRVPGAFAMRLTLQTQLRHVLDAFQTCFETSSKRVKSAIKTRLNPVLSVFKTCLKENGF